jgi:molybdopterin-containing oxidoreductase family iron-sulfur binding subunit
MGISRRDFIRGGALTAVTVAASTGAAILNVTTKANGDPAGPDTTRDLDALRNLPPASGEDSLVTMQRDLVRAMRKPVEQRHWTMLIDTRKCVGCHACTIGCVAENKLPPGVVYRPVMTDETGEFPHLRMTHTPRPCMQCEAPSCVPVCPVRATWKRPDGVVVIDYDKCIGCRHCLTACPYGARTSDFDLHYNADAAHGAGKDAARPLQGSVPSWEEQASSEYGKRWDRAGHGSPIGNARKCHFCLHRLDVGELPVCVTTCIGRATYFGDKNDDNALVMRLLRSTAAQTLLPHRGTQPSVHYIF